MAELVFVGIAPHDPTLPHQVARADEGHPVFRRIREDYERMRAALDAARPDVIVMASGDHFNQWFYDSIPAFAIGKSGRSEGPFPWEREVYGLPPYAAPGHHDFEQGVEASNRVLAVFASANGVKSLTSLDPSSSSTGGSVMVLD